MTPMIEKLQYLQSKTGLVVLPDILYAGVILERHITAMNDAQSVSPGLSEREKGTRTPGMG